MANFRDEADDDDGGNDSGMPESLVTKTSVLADIVSFFKAIQRALRGRQHRRAVRRALAELPPLTAADFPIMVYFADTPVNIYQIQQWYAPLAELAKTTPVAVICRSIAMMRELLDECPLPLFYARTFAEIEEWLGSTPPTIVFYVNQNMRNFQMIRFREPLHIHLSHGESDKDSMTSNQLKAYDYAFIAGDAARERIRNRVLRYHLDERTRSIGRPQVDVDYDAPALPHDSRTTVLYAPTWEGDRPAMTYSSLVSHGPAFVTALLADPRFRLIYRPHPRTGVYDAAFAAVHKRIVAEIERANRADPAAGHLYDADTPFGWHLKHLDRCIADVSAVAFDWLATAKPLIVTEPASPEAEVGADSLIRTLTPLPAARAADIIAELDAADQHAARNRALAEWYFGDITPGASMSRFLAVSAAVLAERRAELADPAGF